MAITLYGNESIGCVECAWTSSAGGTASETTSFDLHGQVLWAAFVPDGVAAPTDNYDVTVTDERGYDVLCGAGANRDTANTEYITSGLGAVASSRLTFSVANAGNAKSGKVALWIG